METKRFWVRWFTGNYADEGCTKPPFHVWCSGSRGRDDSRDEEVLCAVIRARTVADVESGLLIYYPDREMSFCNEIADDWMPSDRFPGYDPNEPCVIGYTSP